MIFRPSREVTWLEPTLYVEVTYSELMEGGCVIRSIAGSPDRLDGVRLAAPTGRVERAVILEPISVAGCAGSGRSSISAYRLAHDNGMLGEAGMKMKLIVGTAALVLSGCAAGPRLTWQNNGQYSTIDIERAFRVDDECRTWHRLATVPGNINTVKVLEREGVSACYRLRGCTMTACSAFSEPSWKGASH